MSGGSRTDFRPESIPRGREPDDPVWRVFEDISAAFERVVDFAVLTEAPKNPQEGFVRYADGQGWDPGFGKGAYEYTDGAWRPLFGGGGGGGAERIIGYYNQVADNVLTGPGAGSPLVVASDASISSGDIYLLATTGAFTTPHPALPGYSGNLNDYIISDGTVWGYIQRDSLTYLRKDVPDTANGHITLAAGGTTIAPTLPDHIARKADVDAAAGGDVDAHNADPAAHQNRITANASNITTIQGEQTVQDDRLDTIDSEQVVQDGRLDTLEDDVQNLECLGAEGCPGAVFAAYGGMKIGAPPVVPTWDLVSGVWQTFDLFDAESVPPLGVTIDLGANSLSPDEEGIYVVSLNGSFGHDSQNFGRAFYVRLWNATTGAPGSEPYVFGIARNQTASPFSVTGLIPITAVVAGDEFQLQMGNGSDVDISGFTAARLDMWNVGRAPA